ncbi:MAG: hypothetical protein K1000chlam3_01169 [Chlamydiae bacterium]|nr:hypothetical protein [Chlamydiota bacterium]
MIVNTVLGLTKMAFEAGVIASSIKAFDPASEFLSDIANGVVGGYFGLKLVDEGLGLNNTEGIRKCFFTAILSAIPYHMLNGNLARRCSVLSRNPYCSILSYNKSLAAVAAGFVFLYALHNFKHRPVFKREVNGNKVEFFEEDGQLKYKVYRRRWFYFQKNILDGKIGANSLDKYSLRRQSEKFKKYEFALNRKKEPIFFRPKWNMGDYKVKIFKNRIFRGLRIEVFEKYKKTRMSASFNSKNVEKSSKTRENSDEHLNLIERDQYFIYALNKFTPVDLKFYGKRFKLVLEPNNCQSRIDSRVRLSELFWGVTLVSHKGPCGNHAQIVIEGMDEGSYFMEIAAFNGPNSVKYADITNKKLRYEKRSHIWKVERYWEGESLRLKIEKSECNPPKEFACGGRYSICSKGADNCFTWAVEMLKAAGIELEKSRIRSVASIVRFFLASDRQLLREKPHCRKNWI